MKKRFGIFSISMFFLFSLTACNLLSQGESPADTLESTSETATQVTEAFTESSTETPTEELTEIPTEIPTEQVTQVPSDPIPEDTLESVVFEDESLNALVEGLRAEGHNMEQLTFHEAMASEKYTCAAFLNHRFYTHGSMLEVTFADLTIDGQAANMDKEFYSAKVMLVRGDTKVVLSRHPWGEDRCIFRTFIGESFAFGVYDLRIELGGETFTVCPVVIYEDSTPRPTAPAVYDDEALNGVMDGLRAEGFDVEKLVFCEENLDYYYAYNAMLNARAFKAGDTVELTIRTLMWYGRDIIKDHEYEGYPPDVRIDGKGFPQPVSDPFEQQNTNLYTYTIPEDATPGVYWIMVYLGGEDSAYIGPIVIC